MISQIQAAKMSFPSQGNGVAQRYGVESVEVIQGAGCLSGFFQLGRDYQQTQNMLKKGYTVY